MKLLVATMDTQGTRKNDFYFCIEGEPVKWTTECDGETVDGNCGCKRSMIGLISNCGTTTMKVVDVKITAKKFREMLVKNYKKAGWYKAYGKKKAEEIIDLEFESLTEEARKFYVGAIYEKRGGVFKVRK